MKSGSPSVRQQNAIKWYFADRPKMGLRAVSHIHRIRTETEPKP